MPIQIKGQSDNKKPDIQGVPEIAEVHVKGVGLVYQNTIIIDDFEDSDHAGWTVPSSTGSDTIVSGLNGTAHAWQFSDFRNAHLAGADAVDRGPQPGDIFEIWFETASQSNPALGRFEFSADGTNDGDMYRVEWEAQSVSNPTVSIEKQVGGGVSKVATTGFSPNNGTVYRCEIRWNAGDNIIEAQMYDSSGSTVSSAVSITDDSSASGGEWTQPGIGLQTFDNTTIVWDEIRIQP